MVQPSLPGALVWRDLTDADLPPMGDLMRRVLGADGGLPLAGEESFLRSRFRAGAGIGAFMAVTQTSGGEAESAAAPVSEARLLAAAGLRRAGEQVTATAVVDPAWRGRGLGTRLLAWCRSAAGTDQVRFETESLTPAADALFRSHGLRPTLTEDVMRRDLTAEPPAASLPDGLTLTPWSPALAERFYWTYREAFADRPNNPGWSAAQWIEWISADEDFAPEWTLLATVDGKDVAFVAAARGAWVVQAGVVPPVRRRGVGAGLVTEVMRRMRAAGEREVFLDVNVDNPGAARLYERLGFVTVGRRARYEPSTPTTPVRTDNAG